MDQQEFVQLYDEHVTAIYRYVFLRVSSVETAEDLTSEVFMKAWAYVGRESLQSPRAFFYRIARNLVIDFYRQKSKQTISLEDLEVQIPDPDQDPSEKTNLSLELAPVRKALANIGDEQADVIIWHYLDELSVPEIADILDKSEGAVRVMLSRGLSRARELVGEV